MGYFQESLQELDYILSEFNDMLNTYNVDSNNGEDDLMVYMDQDQENSKKGKFNSEIFEDFNFQGLDSPNKSDIDITKNINIGSGDTDKNNCLENLQKNETEELQLRSKRQLEKSTDGKIEVVLPPDYIKNNISLIDKGTYIVRSSTSKKYQSVNDLFDTPKGDKSEQCEHNLTTTSMPTSGDFIEEN